MELRDSLFVLLEHQLEDATPDMQSLVPTLSLIKKHQHNASVELQTRLQATLLSYLRNSINQNSIFFPAIGSCLQLCSLETLKTFVELITSAEFSLDLVLTLHILVITNKNISNELLPKEEFSRLLHFLMSRLHQIVGSDDVNLAKKAAQALRLLLPYSTDDVFGEVEKVLKDGRHAPSSVYMILCTLIESFVAHQRVPKGFGRLLVTVNCYSRYLFVAI